MEPQKLLIILYDRPDPPNGIPSIEPKCLTTVFENFTFSPVIIFAEQKGAAKRYLKQLEHSNTPQRGKQMSSPAK
jgi:hypothetical protein